MRKQAFTLIELLIVVAIIAILAAIAVPNFIEAQTRAKVSRVKADMRTADTALNLYITDHGEAPLLNNGSNRDGIYRCFALSTPIAYITSTLLLDPFIPPGDVDENQNVDINNDQIGDTSRAINYLNIQNHRERQGLEEIGTMFALTSFGPDTIRGPNPQNGLGFYAGNNILHPLNTNFWAIYTYDPTNGTVSGGDIMRYQGQ